jgi:hypothetical protein
MTSIKARKRGILAGPARTVLPKNGTERRERKERHLSGIGTEPVPQRRRRLPVPGWVVRILGAFWPIRMYAGIRPLRRTPRSHPPITASSGTVFGVSMGITKALGPTVVGVVVGAGRASEDVPRFGPVTSAKATIAAGIHAPIATFECHDHPRTRKVRRMRRRSCRGSMVTTPESSRA